MREATEAKVIRQHVSRLQARAGYHPTFWVLAPPPVPRAPLLWLLKLISLAGALQRGSCACTKTRTAAAGARAASALVTPTMNGSGSQGSEDTSREGGGGGWQPEAVLVPLFFALIFLVGTVGNTLVLAVLLRGGQAVSTTNLFILNLGVADLCFILCCVPFQATIYTLDDWVFGSLLCKAVHFLIFLTMHASSFTLATVSLDRRVNILLCLRTRVPGRSLGWSRHATQGSRGDEQSG